MDIMGVLMLVGAYAPIVAPIVIGLWATLRKIGHQLKLSEKNALNLERLQAAFTTLNHNSSIIVKALLANGTLTPEDVKDVELT
jgi:hypothetical protein